MEIVLFFTQDVSLHVWEQSGMLNREVALYEAISAKGHGVTFVTYGKNDKVNYASWMPEIRIVANQLKLPIAWYRWLTQMFPPRGDVFKSNQIAGADVALMAARRARKPFVARCGYLPSLFSSQRYGFDSVESVAARKLESRVFKSADRVVVTTSSIREVVLDEYQLDPLNVEIIPNYVETAKFRPKPSATHQPPRIGFVGRLVSQKNLSILLAAAAGLEHEVHIVGTGPLLDELQAQAKSLEVPVRFLGNLPNEQLPSFLNSCDLFVLPSLYEGHPKALLEAMACGLPVIGTRVPGVMELIVDGETGLLCEPDATSLRQAIERILQDEGLRTRLGKNARKYVEENFSLERVLDLEIAMLKKLVA